MASKLKLGIAGLGASAAQVLPALKDLDQIKLTAVADIRQEAADKIAAQYNVQAFNDVAALAASPLVDAVWIATPNMLHAEHTILCAEHGKHVICEKPMAISLEQCKAMIAACERNRVKYVQGHSKIYESPIKQMRGIIQGGKLGRVFQIQTSNFNDWLMRPRLASEVDSTQGGGIVFRQGPHQVDIVRYLGGGMVKSVRAATSRHDSNFDTEGGYTAWLEFEDGTVATLAMNGYGYFDVTELTWNIGEGGRVLPDPEDRPKKVRPTGPMEAPRKYALTREVLHGDAASPRKQPFFGLTLVSCEKGVIRQSPAGLYVYTEAGREEVMCGKSLGRGAELVELYDAIKHDRPSFPDARWGMATLEVCLAMLQSSQAGREVQLAHQVPSPV